MSDFKNIVDFLRLRRRAEEAEKNIKLQTDVLLTYLEDNGSYHADKNIFETDFNKYKRIFHILEDYNAENIYLWETPAERKYFVKTPVDKYCNLLDQTMEIVPDDELTAFPREFATGSYIYDTEKNRVVILAETLKEIVVFPDIIYYNPEGEFLKEVDNDEYQYSYSDDTTFFAEVIKILFIDAKRLVYDSEKKVIFQKAEKSGRMRLIPFMQADIAHKTFILKYPYFQKGYQPTIRLPDEDCAMIIKFTNIGGILSFLNETLFDQGFDLARSENSIRDAFRQQFMDQIIHTLEDKIKSNSKLYYQDVMEILYYLPESIALIIDNEALWMLVEEGIRRDSLTNKLNIAEENIYIKLLELVLQKEGQENRFIERLNQKIKDGEKYVTILEYLIDRIQGNNKLVFAGLVNRAWRKTRFVDANIETNPEYKSTNGPKFLPYHSEKIAGFFFSNISADFQDNPTHKTERILQLNYETGKYHDVPAANVTGKKSEEIVEHYSYHPFYPVKIKNTDKEDTAQETAIKLDAIVPAFMLKINSEEQFWHNVIKSGEYALDIIAIAASYGTLSELAAAEIISSLAIVRGVGAVAGLTSSVANVILKLANAENSELGQAFCEYLFWIEMLSLSGELTVAIKNGLKRSATELIGKEENFAKLEKQLDDAVIEENGTIRKLTKDEKENVFRELKENFNKSNDLSNTDKLSEEIIALENAEKGRKKPLFERKRFREFINKADSKRLVASQISLTKIIVNLKGFTAKSNEIASLLEKGKINIKFIESSEFTEMLIQGGDSLKEAENTTAMVADMETIMVRANAPVERFMGEVVHEGSHILDIRKMKELLEKGYSESEIIKIMGDVKMHELRAYFHERAFQIASGSIPDYNTIQSLKIHIVDGYSSREVPYDDIFEYLKDLIKNK